MILSDRKPSLFLLFGLPLFAGALWIGSACVNTCTLRACTHDVYVALTDVHGDEIAAYNVVATVEDQSLEVSCVSDSNPAASASAEVLAPGGHTAYVTIRCWRQYPDSPPGLWFEGIWQEDLEIELSISSPQGSYEGPLAYETEVLGDFNGEGCGECEIGEGTIVLE